MTSSLRILGLFSVLFLSALAACTGLVSNSESLRYKLTITIETPRGEVTGFAVKEAKKFTEKSILPDQGGVSYQITEGQAVVFDLGNGDIAFAPQEWENEARLAFHSLKPDGSSGVVQVPVSQYPIIVQFIDFSDPDKTRILFGPEDCLGVASDREKHPGSCHLPDRSKEYVGRDVKIRSVTMEVSSSPLTSGIEKFLPPCDDKFHLIDSMALRMGKRQ